MGLFFSSNKTISSNYNTHIDGGEQTNKNFISNKKILEINKNIDLQLHPEYKIGENLEIIFKNSFNKTIEDKEINKFRLYDKIIFGFSFNQSITNKIPSNIIFIKFGHNYNKSIEQIVIDGEEDNIQELILGEKFNLPVKNISPNIKKLTFGNDFNLPVDNLPCKLEFIKFGNNFNQNVDYLPCSLKEVIFGNSFNHQLENLPSSIEIIELGQNFNHSITFLPIGLRKLILNKVYYEKNKNVISKLVSGCEIISLSY